MTKEPELPDFVKDLEILESLDRLEHPLASYTAEAVKSEELGRVDEGTEGLEGLTS